MYKLYFNNYVVLLTEQNIYKIEIKKKSKGKKKEQMY